MLNIVFRYPVLAKVAETLEMAHRFLWRIVFAEHTSAGEWPVGKLHKASEGSRTTVARCRPVRPLTVSRSNARNGALSSTSLVFSVEVAAVPFRRQELPPGSGQEAS